MLYIGTCLLVCFCGWPFGAVSETEDSRWRVGVTESGLVSLRLHAGRRGKVRLGGRKLAATPCGRAVRELQVGHAGPWHEQQPLRAYAGSRQI